MNSRNKTIDYLYMYIYSLKCHKKVESPSRVKT